MLIDGKSQRQTALLTGVDRKQVRSWWRKYQETGRVERKVGSGRKKKIDSRTSSKMTRWIKSGRFDTGKEVQRQLNNDGISVSHSTVNREMRRRGMIPVVKRKLPLLTDIHKKKRLDFAKKYRNWTVDDWSKVIFSDESKVCRDGSDGRRYVWKDRGQQIEGNERLTYGRRQFGGGSVMIWSCMGAHGVGLAVRLYGSVTSELYIQVMQEDLLNSVEKCVGDEEHWIFQQDNATIHKSRATKEWFASNNVNLLDDWPPNSPDLNPIEHMWSQVKKIVYRKDPFESLDCLWECFCQEWNNTTTESCQTLIKSMPDRIKSVLKSKGGVTSW